MTPPSQKPATAEGTADVNLPIDQALSQAKTAIAQGMPIGRQLGDLLRRELERSSSRSTAKVRRLLELLAGLECEAQVLPVRSLLLSDPDSHIRSKGTLLIGRATRSVAAISRRLLDPDTRVQANAVESLWGVDTPEAREFLGIASGSRHNRVAANALVGLYRLHDLSGIPKLYAMAAHAQEGFRISAYWAMGETGDPRFLPFMQAAFTAGEPACRGIVLRSMKRLHQRMTALQQLPRLQVRALDSSTLPEGRREIRFAVLRLPGDNPLLIEPTNVVVVEGSRPVYEFTFSPLPDPELFAVGFTIPRVLGRGDPYLLGTEGGLERVLPVKPKHDLWVIDRYLYGDQRDPHLTAGLTEVEEDPAVAHHRRLNRGFLTDPHIIEKAIPGPGSRDAASQNMLASIRKMIDSVGRASGSRHVFVFLDPQPSEPELEIEKLTAEAKEAALSVHCILTDPALEYPGMQALCTATGGHFYTMPAERIAEELPGLYQSLRNRFRIVYPKPDPESAAATVEVSLYGRDGLGQFSIDVR